MASPERRRGEETWGGRVGSPTREVPPSNHIVLKCEVLKCRWSCLWSTQGSGGEGVPVWVGEDPGTEVLDFAHTEVLVGGIWNLKCNKLYIRRFLHVQIRC